MGAQDSPNERGVMGSKASGEPSLLLSVSILHAMRGAVQAARAELAAAKAPVPPKALPAASTSGEGLHNAARSASRWGASTICHRLSRPCCTYGRPVTHLAE